MSAPVLEARGITKRFPGVLALKDVSFDLRAGEIHALCGENGAGKSTLIKLLSGIHPHGSYEGALLVHGRPSSFASIRDAERAGIAVIYQELALVEEMSVAENLFLGAEPRRGLLIDWLAMQRNARSLLERFGLKIDPATPCSRLGIGQKQLIEILKALAKNSRILILDEPTAALAGHEVQVLLEILRGLRAEGIACIYISHKLEEVFAIADRITVLRDGETVTTQETSAITRADVIRHMVGRELRQLFPDRAAPAARPEPLLKIENLTVADAATGRVRLREISLEVAAGEVVGIGGLMGAGRTELLMHLFGAWGERRAGVVRLDNAAFAEGTPTQMLRRKIALVSEDRRRYGLILEQPIGFNLSLSSLGPRHGARRHSRAARVCPQRGYFPFARSEGAEPRNRRRQALRRQPAEIVLGKVLLAEPRVILLDEPTRGIDVGAKAEIYALIGKLTEAGKAVLLVSSELPELLGLSDRILMLHEGRISGEFSRGEATQEQLMAAALGQLSA
jgi:D-xylose transport system ATP-binding protein